MPELASRILTLRPSLLDTPDSFMWHLQKSGSYSAKSGYFALTSIKTKALPRLQSEDWNWKNKRFKIKVFLCGMCFITLYPLGKIYKREGCSQTPCAFAVEHRRPMNTCSFIAPLRKRCGP
ncbi:hypothetical protein F2Q68_00027184 [Brassica cretica]|uniref:Uncharacterized protein n=1 Tax=Brassica cretica TaxID=69181 RepID=A0A8S9IAX6_BRACR|nr:hypothetical protein F2Q68_00027184 [Brassica cretica]